MSEVRTYSVSVEGYGPQTYCARSPAKARARAYRDYQVVSTKTFGEFLSISSIRRIDNPPGVGDRIMVSGLPATRVYHPCAGSGYTWFMRDDSDVVLCSHPADVTESGTRPPVYSDENARNA